ncbi:MAG: hypothetical protein PVSMB7_22570 [Chloroflexota bacterium]
MRIGGAGGNQQRVQGDFRRDAGIPGISSRCDKPHPGDHKDFQTGIEHGEFRRRVHLERSIALFVRIDFANRIVSLQNAGPGTDAQDMVGGGRTGRGKSANIRTVGKAPERLPRFKPQDDAPEPAP